MKAEEFLKAYERATNSHDFSKVAPLIDDDAIYWFSDGSFEGIDAIKEAFENTWGKVKDEVYEIKSVRWLAKSDTIAICVYEFFWQGYVDGVKKSGNGRGTNVLVNTNGSWQITHEHLSK